MRTLVGLLLLLVLVPSGWAAPFKVATWNLEWYPTGGTGGGEPVETKVTGAKDALKRVDPDIFVAEEVADWESALDLCAVVPGLNTAVVSNFGYPQNIVIASKLPADSAWYEKWKEHGSVKPPRGFAFAALKRPDGSFLLVYGVHLKANSSKGIDPNIPPREEAAKQLVAHIKAMEKIYGEREHCEVIVAGDFNSSMEDPKFRKDSTLKILRGSGLKWLYQNIPLEDRITIPAKDGYPDNCFDHMFYSSGLKLLGVKIIPRGDVSDHNGVLAGFSE